MVKTCEAFRRCLNNKPVRFDRREANPNVLRHNALVSFVRIPGEAPGWYFDQLIIERLK